MANEYSVNKSDLESIADAMREKLEITEKLVFPPEFVVGIDNVYDAGTGALWDQIQSNGTRKGYESAFLEWGAEYIRPKNKVIPSSYAVRNMFGYCPNLKKIESEYFDLSQAPTSDTTTASSWYLTFAGCSSLVEIEDIGMRPGYYYRTWRNCPKLETIGKIRFNETTMIYQAFDGCTSLKNIVVEGTIGQGVSFASCPLSAESAVSVLRACKSYHGDSQAGTRTITFSSATVNELDKLGNVFDLGDAMPGYEGTMTEWRDYMLCKEWNF